MMIMIEIIEREREREQENVVYSNHLAFKMKYQMIVDKKKKTLICLQVNWEIGNVSKAYLIHIN